MNIDEREKRELLKELTLKKINYLLKKGDLDDVDVYEAAKDFFKEYYDLDYEFTIQEFKEELEGVFLETDTKKEILKFVDQLHLMEYTDKKYGQKELEELLQELKVILHKLIILEEELRLWDTKYWKNKLREVYQTKEKEVLGMKKPPEKDEQKEEPPLKPSKPFLKSKRVVKKAPKHAAKA